MSAVPLRQWRRPPKALRVAIVEDDPRIQQLISAEITDEGHACICFGSAEDFLTKAKIGEIPFGAYSDLRV